MRAEIRRRGAVSSVKVVKLRQTFFKNLVTPTMKQLKCDSFEVISKVN